MNKKLVLSVLSTAVVASMATSAFAAPKAGVYLGGNVKKFYALETLFGLNASAKTEFSNYVAQLASNFNQVVYVDNSGKGASIQEILDEGYNAALNEPLAAADFADQYSEVNTSGQVVGTVDPEAELGGTPAELKVESVSAIDDTTVEVAFNNAVDATQVITENFTILDKNSKYVGDVTKALLSEDGKKVTLTVPQLTAAGQPYTLVLNKNAFNVPENTKTIQLSVDAPSATTITVDGKKQFTLAFDKTVKAVDADTLKNNVTVVDQTDTTKTYSVATASAASGKLVVTTNEDLTPGHNYKVTVAKDVLVDAWGTKNAAVEKSFSVVTNATKPAVQSVRFVKSETGEIDAVVTFNIAVYNNDGDISVQLQNRTDFTTTDSYDVGVMDSKTDAATVAARVKDLKLESNQLLLTHINQKAMTAGKEYGLIIAAGEVKDTTLAALTNDKATGIATYNIDIVAPEVTAEELVSATELKLTLSEAVTFNSSKVVTVSGFKADGTTGDIEATVSLSSDGKTATLRPKTSGEKFATAAIEDNVVKIAGEAFTDAAGNKFAEATVTLDAATDKAAPVLVTAKYDADTKTITLAFTEEVDRAGSAPYKSVVVNGKSYANAEANAESLAGKWALVTGNIVITASGSELAVGSQVTVPSATVKDLATTANTNAVFTVASK